MTANGLRMRARKGFTALELVVVLLLGGIVAAVAIPNVRRGLNQARSQGAATVIASDIELAFSVAARQRTPVQIVVDTANRHIRIRDFTTPTRVFNQRHFNARSEHPVQSMTADALVRTVLPNGLADGPLSITVNAGGRRRTISMTRVGHVRVSAP